MTRQPLHRIASICFALDTCTCTCGVTVTPATFAEHRHDAGAPARYVDSARFDVENSGDWHTTMTVGDNRPFPKPRGRYERITDDELPTRECPRGHVGGYVRHEGGPECLPCRRERDRERYAARKVAVA